MERDQGLPAFLGREEKRRDLLRGSLKLMFFGGSALLLSRIPDGIGSGRALEVAEDQRPLFGGYTRPQDYDSSPTPIPSLLLTPQPIETATATSTPLADRDNCDDIRGTDYHSAAERQWYLKNCVSSPSPETAASLSGVYRHGDRSSPYICLTIDDGWDLQMVKTALDIAARRRVRLTIFPAGRMIDAGPAIFARAVDEGHEIANHTYSHTWLTALTREGILNEIEMAQAALDRALSRHYKMRFLRPPGMAGFTSGNGEPRIRAAIFEKGLAVALWDVDTFYGAIKHGGGAEDVLRVVASGAQNGSIVLQHFTGADVEALEGILNWVESRGLVPVTISELLKT